jgi:hypothetical protein
MLLGNPILRAFVATAFTAQFFYSVIMAIYILFLTQELALSPAVLGIVFGLGGGTGVLVGSASAARVSAGWDLAAPWSWRICYSACSAFARARDRLAVARRSTGLRSRVRSTVRERGVYGQPGHRRTSRDAAEPAGACAGQPEGPPTRFVRYILMAPASEKKSDGRCISSAVAESRARTLRRAALHGQRRRTVCALRASSESTMQAVSSRSAKSLSSRTGAAWSSARARAQWRAGLGASRNRVDLLDAGVNGSTSLTVLTIPRVTA